MPTSLSLCARLLKQDGIRHHLDEEDGVVLAVFVTRSYENARGEHLAIVRIETPDDGRRCRASIAQAFRAHGDPGVACLAACRLAATTPLVGVEYDAATDSLGLVVETVVEDGRLTKLQIFTMIDRLVETVEAWQTEMRVAMRRGTRKRGAA